MPKPQDEAEEGDGKLATDPEIEAAMREAEEALDAASAEASAGEPTPDGEPAEADTESDLEAATASAASKKSPTEEVEELSAELIETKDLLLRLQADFDNFRKRALKERQEALQYGHQNLVKDLLSAVDNLERAVDHAGQSGDGDLENLLQGVELVQRELLAALGNHGVVQVEARGKPFDPSIHEAMAQAPDDTVPPNTVIDVFQQGYVLRDRLIRPARVVVAKAPEGTESDGGEEAGG